MKNKTDPNQTVTTKPQTTVPLSCLFIYLKRDAPHRSQWITGLITGC